MSIPGKDREKADLALLIGSGAGEILRSALMNMGQPAVIRGWEVHSIHHRPGAGVTAGYSVTLDRILPNGAHMRVEEYLCASTARLSHPNTPGLVYVSKGDSTFSVWRYPADPELPALFLACSPEHMSALLGMPVSVELMSYRPTRRAVVRVRAANSVSYAKVARPPQVESLAKRHIMLSRAGIPAPPVLIHDVRGLLVIGAANGIPLSTAISRGMGRNAAPLLGSLTALLNALPREALSLSHRPAWADRSTHYAHAAGTALPEERARCEAVAHGIHELLASSDPGPLVPVHGDFYEANIFVSHDSSRVTGIIDVDSLGPGHRVDDWACLLGHMSVLPHLAPDSYPYVRDDLPIWRDACEHAVDPVALCARTAGVVLSLVAGAKRVDGAEWIDDALGRLSTAEAWLERAYRHR